jgi:hypothetical protein
MTVAKLADLEIVNLSLNGDSHPIKILQCRNQTADDDLHSTFFVRTLIEDKIDTSISVVVRIPEL